MGAKNLKNELEAHQYLSVKQIAERTTYHVKTIRRLISEGTLKSIKLGGKRLVSYADFLTFMKSYSE